MIMKNFIFKIVVLVLKKVIFLVFLKEDLRGFKEEMIKKPVKGYKKKALERIQCLFSWNGGADGTYKADAYEAVRKPETIAAFEEWHWIHHEGE